MSEPTQENASIGVHLLPDLVHPHDLAGHVVVVVDVLRATTSVAAALAAGARRIIPCLEVAEARELAHKHGGPPHVLLGGERGGRPIDGFDLGNSPAEYLADRIAGKTLVFTTTNGTRAMMRCVGAGRVLLGSFGNLTALADELRPAQRVEIVCAGTDGSVSWEDTLFAGALVDRLLPTGNRDCSDAARIAHQCWLQTAENWGDPLFAADWLRKGQGGQNLLAIGREADIEFSACLDRWRVLPELYLSDWMVRDAARSRPSANGGRAHN